MNDERQNTHHGVSDALRSQLPGIRWPAIVGGGDAASMALLFQMESLQWLPSQVLRERQQQQLTELIDHARRYSRFHRGRLPNDSTHWQDFPVLTREDLQAHAGDMWAATYPREHGKSFEIATGGSTAQPVKVRRTELTHLFWRATTLRDHLWHRRDLAATMAIIRQFPGPVDEKKPGTWGDMLKSGPAWHLPISTDVPAQSRWLQRVDPDILLTYPANLDALLSHLQQEGVALPRLREVRTVSGSVSPALRERCRQVLGAPVTDLYSAQEFGVIALQCPASGLLHVQSEHLLVEVINEDGRRCKEGEVGQVVVTDLHNFAMPLIRYSLGDWAEVGPICPCGRGLPTLRRVLGRTRNMAVSPDGELFWPALDTARLLEAIPHLRQYQLHQTAADALTVRLVCVPRPTMSQLSRLREVLTQLLGRNYTWKWQFFEKPLPLSSSGKFEEFISFLPRKDCMT